MALSQNDRQLAVLLKNDPARGLEEAVARYGGAVRTICAAILGTDRREEVEEAMADSFVALWQGMERYDPALPIAPYLYGIARRTALGRRRTLGRTDQTAAKENARLLRQAVEALPPPDREIFIRRYYLYQKVNDIAARLGLPPKTVENKLCRGRQRLRRELLERGVIL